MTPTRELTPFAGVYPGQTIALSTGELLTIGPLSAFAVTHEVPALIGRIASKLAPYQTQLSDTSQITQNLGSILAAAAPELVDLLCHTTGLDKKRVTSPPPEGIFAEELMDILLLLLKSNVGFFAKVVQLRAFAQTELAPAGRGSTSPSSAPGSESTS